MKEIYYSYNNEALASCVLFSVIREMQNIDYARLLLILPFLFDNRIISSLKNEGQIDLEEFIKVKPKLFTAFNKRFLNLMPVTINSIMLLKKSNQISINKEITCIGDLSLADIDLGERFEKIKNVLPNFLMLLEDYSTIKLYEMLKIQL
jgi:hypothetical protein